MTAEIHSLGHVALETPDLDASLDTFVEAMGFEETDRRDGTVYLRASDEFQHHSLSLAEADTAGVDHIGWQTADRESLDEFADRLAEHGIAVHWVEAGTELGQGEAIQFETPGGHRFELFHEMASPEAPPEKRSKLKNKPFAEGTTHPIAPTRIDHVQIWDSAAHDLANWLCEHLGFRVQESYDNTDGSRWGTFVSANGIKIEAAVIQDDDPEAPASLNHIAYKAKDGDHLFAAASAMRDRGIPTDGFGQHSISRGMFCYARDPVSDHTIEFNAGGYLVFDPNWEPVRWEASDLEDRQWIGSITGGVNVPYS